MKKAISIIALVIVALTILALPASAATPYYTYTYSIDGQDLRSPHAYVPDGPESRKTAETMGLTDEAYMRSIYPDLPEEELKEKMGKLGSTTDLEVDEDGNVYLVDKDKNRVVVLDKYYKVKFVINTFKNASGNIDTFSNPSGVFITDDKIVNGEHVEGRIFVCDTNNQRIVTFDKNGEFLSVIGKPRSEFLDATKGYDPIALAVDRYDRLYVVAPNSGNGIMVMTDTGEFTGFIGAQQVAVSAWEELWKKFRTEEQQDLVADKATEPYNNITLAGDFIYVTITPSDTSGISSAITNKEKTGDNAPVKMLNAAGAELMRRNGFYPPSGEVAFSGSEGVSSIDAGSLMSKPSKIVDVAVGPENTWSIIDQDRGKVFTYDFDGNLLFAFGDKGEAVGNVTILSAVSYQGDKMILLDNNPTAGVSFTVYDRTDYGDVLIGALANQNARRYNEAINDWTEVLMRNSNFDAAYIGIGNALYRNHEYEAAVEQFKYAYDTENYSNAYSELRQEWVSEWLWTIPLIVAVLCFALIKFSSYVKRLNKKVSVTAGKRTYWQELMFAFHLMLHPFDGFWDLKHEKRGSVRAGTTIMVVAIATVYYQSVGSGYIMNPQAQYMSVWAAILTVVIPLALWIVANWCITTLFDGEGSLKDIYIASTYSLMPMILTMIPATIASNVVLASETKIITLVTTIGFIWLGLLLFFGMMITHDYTIGKNVVTTLSTIVGMICIMFIVILFSTLLGKLVGFGSSIFTEIQYRV